MIDSVLHPNPSHFPQRTASLSGVLDHRNKIRLLITLVMPLLLWLFFAPPTTLLAQENSPPRVIPVPTQEMYVDDVLWINVRATDPQSDTVTFEVDEALSPLPNGAELLTTVEEEHYWEAIVIFAPTAAGTYDFAVVAVDDGEPQGRTALFFQVIVRELPAEFADLALESITVESTASDGKVRVGELFDLVIDVKNQTNATLAAADSTLDMSLDAPKLSLVQLDDGCKVNSPTGSIIDITCSFGAIPVGALRRVRLTLVPTNEGFANNQFSAATTTFDPIKHNHTKNAEIDIEPPLVDLEVLQRIVSGGDRVGDTVVIELTVRNHSALESHFALNDTFTEGFALVNVEGVTAGNCSIFEQEVNCDDKVGALREVVYLITARLTEQGEQEATASVVGIYADPIVPNNQASIALTVVVEADIHIDLTLLNNPDSIEVGDEVYVLMNVTVVSTTNSVAIDEVVVTGTVSSGVALLQANPAVEVLCDIAGSMIICSKLFLQPGDGFMVPLVLFAETEGVKEVSASVGGRFVREVQPADNLASQLFFVKKATAHWLIIHTYDDRNGNGRQDPGEPALPEVKIDTTSSDGQESKVDQGGTDARGFLKQPILEDSSRLRVTAKVTLTRSITPVISVKLNAVPPTGQATITGGDGCLMTVGNNDGSTVTLPCSDEDRVEWENQVNASVADFTAKLSALSPQTVAANQQSLEPVTVTFEVIAAESQVIYLPIVSK